MPQKAEDNILIVFIEIMNKLLPFNIDSKFL